MNELVEQNDVNELVDQLNELVQELEQYPDTELREKALGLVQLILQLHGDALRRILATFESLPMKSEIYSRMLRDEVITALLTIHDLMPEELETRTAKAIEELRPFLISQGCDVQLISVENQRASLRLMRSGKGAPPIAAMKLEIEKVLDVAAPDLLGIHIEGWEEQIKATHKAATLLGNMLASASGDTGQSARLIQIKRAPLDEEKIDGTWISVVRAIGFEEAQLKIVSYADVNLLLCRIGEEFYAYSNQCAVDGRTLDGARFESPVLTCACHDYHYDLRQGTCREDPTLRLHRLPVKVEENKVKVAL